MTQANPRRRRGTTKHSITYLTQKIEALEAQMGPPNPAIVDQAQHLKVKLDSLDAEFKTHHYAVVDTISDEGEQGKEQSEHCQRPHHTLIHKDAEAPPPQPQTGSVPVTTHTTLD